MIRLITSLNWVLGTLAIAAAFAYPFVSEALLSVPRHEQGKAAVLAIADAQNAYYQARERYVYFSSDRNDFAKGMAALKNNSPQLNVKRGLFHFQAYTDKNSVVVIRAFVSPQRLREGWHKPMAFVYRINEPGDKGDGGQWIEYSNRAPGLF